MARHTSGIPAVAQSGIAGDQPGACPVLDGPPTFSELPTDQGTSEPTGLIYLDQSDGIVKVTVPDGSGGTATETVVDSSASVNVSSGDTTGLL